MQRILPTAQLSGSGSGNGSAAQVRACVGRTAGALCVLFARADLIVV